MATFYLGAAVREAPPEFREFTDYVGQAIERYTRMERLKFLGAARPEGVSVYAYDMEMATKADLGVFLFDHASTGMGMEVERRHLLGKKSIFFAREPEQCTAMALHLSQDHSIPYFSYRTDGEIGERVFQWLPKLFPSW